MFAAESVKHPQPLLSRPPDPEIDPLMMDFEAPAVLTVNRLPPFWIVPETVREPPET